MSSSETFSQTKFRVKRNMLTFIMRQLSLLFVFPAHTKFVFVFFYSKNPQKRTCIFSIQADFVLIHREPSAKVFLKLFSGNYILHRVRLLTVEI